MDGAYPTMTVKRWRKLPAPPPGFSQRLGFPPFQAHLLYNRGIRERSQVGPYLAADWRLRNDPMLLPDMDVAVSRLRGALDNGETIGVFGDFDADGVTGTALLVRGLGDLGARVVPYLPNRLDEGHGLSVQAVQMLADRGVTLLVTVDCGATSVDEMAFAASLGLDTIVTDHHMMTDTHTPACALINPKRPDSAYPYSDLTGVGMAFKLFEALSAELNMPWPSHLLGLVALGTVADMGPLTGENRFLVKEGIDHLRNTESPGIKALAGTARVKLSSLDTEDLSFRLIPRLNAPGRMGDAQLSLDLLTTVSEDEARSLAQSMEALNQERRALTEEAMEEAAAQLPLESGREDVPPIVIVESETWPPGILGLIAGRLSERYDRPAIAICRGPEASRASARSGDAFDLFSLLEPNQELFDRFGGHAQAAGFTLPTASLPALRDRIVPAAEAMLDGFQPRAEIEADCEVPLALPAREQFDFIQSLQPFGAQNAAPVFLTRRARVVDARMVGQDGRHLKLRIWDGSTGWDAIAFRQGGMLEAAQDRIDVLYTVGLNDWGGRARIQLNVLDMRRAL